MTMDEICSAVAALQLDIEKNPQDTQSLIAQIQVRLSEARALGGPLPRALRDVEEALAEEEAEDFFDNMPV